MTDILGVIGGMGPMAGGYLCQLITQKTKASTDAEHIDMVLASFPRIPDRTAYLLDKSKPNPADEIIRIGKSLVDQAKNRLIISWMRNSHRIRVNSLGQWMALW